MKFIAIMRVVYILFWNFAGIGLTGVELAAQFAVQKSFQEKRLMANGIFTSGTGLGMLLMSPVTQSLLDIYGFHGTLLVLSGIALHGVVFGLSMLYSLPDPLCKESRTIERSTSIKLDEIASDSGKLETIRNNEKDLILPEKKLKEKFTLKQASHVSQNYDSIKNSKNEKQYSATQDQNEMHGYLGLLKNKYYLIYTIGSVLSHTAMKAVIGKYILFHY